MPFYEIIDILIKWNCFAFFLWTKRASNFFFLFIFRFLNCIIVLAKTKKKREGVKFIKKKNIYKNNCNIVNLLSLSVNPAILTNPFKFLFQISFVLYFLFSFFLFAIHLNSFVNTFTFVHVYVLFFFVTTLWPWTKDFILGKLKEGEKV